MILPRLNFMRKKLICTRSPHCSFQDCSKDVDKIKSELEKVNEAWKNASEELYKAQAENQPQANTGDQKKSSKKDDNDDVQDVDFEEVK